MGRAFNPNEWVQRMMMAPNPTTPETTIAPPYSSPPTIVGSKPMAPQNRDQQQTPPPPPPGPFKCPRCDSSNTKFCYYNNYSLSQPRHFCKACKRYWTRGGTLRNVPVGGGCRKNKRVSKKHQNAPADQTPSASAATKNPNPNNPLINLPTTSSSDQLNSFIYASFSTAYDDDNNNIGGLGIPSNQLSSGLINLHQASENFLTNEYPSFKFGPQDAATLLQQDCASANLGLKDVKAEGIESINAMGNNINSDDIHLWQTNYPFDQALNADSTYMYWNPPIGGTCWPDATANSSVAPLI